MHIHSPIRQTVQRLFNGVCLFVAGICIANVGCIISNCDPPRSVPCDYQVPSPLTPFEIRALCGADCQENMSISDKNFDPPMQSTSQNDLLSNTLVDQEIEPDSTYQQKRVRPTFGKGWSSQLSLSTNRNTIKTDLQAKPTTAKKPVSSAPLMPNFR